MLYVTKFTHMVNSLFLLSFVALISKIFYLIIYIYMYIYIHIVYIYVLLRFTVCMIEFINNFSCISVQFSMVILT